jgi:hypothetical protein
VNVLTVAFAGASSGAWHVERFETVSGSPLAHTSHLEVIEGAPPASSLDGAGWVLRGVTSSERYVIRAEHDALVTRQESLGQREATRAALIPIKKSGTWWEPAQDERRRNFEERSHHVATGLEYLPAIARRLYHARDLGQPFDFLTWFEFVPLKRPPSRNSYGDSA